MTDIDTEELEIENRMYVFEIEIAQRMVDDAKERVRRAEVDVEQAEAHLRDVRAQGVG